ncbi:MAG: hypothetical protein GY765_22185, partial [bacterium]|nr:hypothetical protein [bacterium]
MMGNINKKHNDLQKYPFFGRISRRKFIKNIVFAGAASTFSLKGGLRIFSSAEAAENEIEADAWYLSLCPYCG